MKRAIEFVKEAWAELKQVAWLSVPQMIASTWIVIILVIVIAAYIFGVDYILKNIFEILV